MNRYARLISLRLAWWYVWWSICALILVLCIFSTLDMFRFPEFHSTLSIIATAFWICVFALVVPNMKPNKSELLEKDLRRRPDNIYAKAMLLEIAVNNKKKEADKKKEDDVLRERIKAMENETKRLEK